ncbi:MAG: hypothetical protein GTO18_04380 [Anaerolineales bacterium]|nr:hypothetical protein [Anaerolineales bacterium]
MTAFCTYCSAEKNHAPGDLPAIKRYLSQRIRSVYATALSAGIPFFILSGEFGLLEPCDPIPDYEHLLVQSEVNIHAELVAGQFQDFGVKGFVFFTVPVSQDPNVAPYIECMKAACERAGVEMSIVEISGDG